MRPIKLLLTAFGPYKDKEVIDFTELGDQNLFVISGKTGSGKTTIFDGISFALYGSASGEDRENVAMLRSQFANDDLHTAVEFIFELKNRRYRVLRQLGHVKEGNKTKTGEKYEFFEQTAEGEVPGVDRQIVSEINKKIESLIGLTQEQFKQIVMLPQGEFRKFLTSETENKEAILRRLFKTEPYQEIEEKLKEKQNELKDIYNKDVQQLDSLIRNIEATIPEREESSLLNLIKEQSYNTHQILDALVKESKYYKQKIKTDESTYNQSHENYETSFVKYGEAENTNEQFAKRSDKLKEMKELQAKQEEQLIAENKLKKAENANKLLPYEQQLEELREELLIKNTALKETEMLNKTNEKTLNIKSILYQEARGTEADRDKINIKIDTLSNYIPLVKDLKELTEQLNTEEKIVVEYSKNYEELTNRLKSNEYDLEEAITEIELIDQKINTLPEKEQRKKSLQLDWKKLNEYKEIKEQQKILTADYTKKRESYEKTHRAYELAEQSWLNNEAAYLATHLHDGQACQVCGSKTHPNKAVYEKDVLTESELKELKVSRDDYQREFQKTIVSIEQNEVEQRKYIKEIKELDYNPENIKGEIENIETEGRQLAEDIKALKEEQNKRENLIEKRSTLRKKINEEKHTQELLNEKTEKIRKEHTEKKALYHAKLSSLPEDYRDLSRVESKLNEAIKHKEKLDSELKKAEKEYNLANNAYLESSTNLNQLTKQVGEIKQRLSTAENKFNHELAESDFISLNDFKDAKLAKDSQNELKIKIEKYNKKYTELTHDLNQLNHELKDKEIHDLKLLEEKVSKLRALTQSNYDILQESKRAYSDIGNLVKHIKSVREAVQKNEKVLLTLTDLYDITRGHNEQKISFERFLQIEYLEQIIHAANIRLNDLSNGQFNLILSERQETHGRQSGLSLDVDDAYTGQIRDVKTLSGGEKFNASLALALGMSDVIQSFEGNISIEMMFIDEGFGSLDEESLTKAIDTLIDLQKSGRLIGVISHVEELKAVIPAILEVNKTKEGYSETRFNIK
ncbi:MAG TPA: AAA family ATPase [Pseudogracilibacillus sp.]|nr:AAA family ATPase [Pseudogracilibacillus sp.]